MRSVFLPSVAALLFAGGAFAGVRPDSAPGAREIIEFKQVVQPVNQDEEGLRDQVSPDGRRAFIVTRKADVASDRNRYEIQLIDLDPDRLAAQRAPNSVTVFSADAVYDNDSGHPAVQNVQWHGDGTLVFLARLDGETFQVYRLDIQTRALVQLTHETNLIVSYDVSQDLEHVVYAAQVPNPPLAAGEHAVVVGSQSFWKVKFGQHDLGSQDRLFRYFVVDVALNRPPRPLGPEFTDGGTTPTVSVSPDGRWALLPRYEIDRLEDWARRYPIIAELSKIDAKSFHSDPLHYFSNPRDWVPRRMIALRLEDGMEQAVVDAPDDLHGPMIRRDRLWQGGGTSVVLAGTHLPKAADGTSSPASHIIEYWPEQGRWRDIARLENRFEDAHPLRDGFFVLDGRRRREFRRQADGGWRESIDKAERRAEGSAWTLRLTQGLNQPPDVYASGPAGETRRLTSLNPQFDARTWGKMKPYAWQDAAGRHWNGGLMSGPETDAGGPHPLLIQTYGFSPNRFYLDGPNDFDGATSGFAGRAFLREGILVLAMPWGAVDAPPEPGHRALESFNTGVKGVIDALVKEGRVDPSRVGIIGWSATGERVLNLVTFGDVPIRAGSLVDGDANTLFDLTVSYGSWDGIWARVEDLNEGLPFGDRLVAWVKNDPALHTDCIHAAMRIETYGPWVLPNWDIYGLLRRQYKAAEMIVIPGGTHQLSTPGDRMASLQGNVDWYGFWLTGKTRTAPVQPSESVASLAAQAARWRELETLKSADDTKPRCVR